MSHLKVYTDSGRKASWISKDANQFWRENERKGETKQLSMIPASMEYINVVIEVVASNLPHYLQLSTNL